MMNVLRKIGRILTCYLCCDDLSDDDESDEEPLIRPCPRGISRARAWLAGYNHAEVLAPEDHASALPFHNCDDTEFTDETTTTSMEPSTPSENLDSPVPSVDSNVSELKDLKDEVETLEACGTQLQTPAGIEEVSDKLEASPIHAVTPYEALGKQCGSPKHIRSLMSEGKEGSKFEIPGLPSAATQRKNKSVRFEIQVDTEPCFKDKACSTPLYITDDMQTPGTVYASNQKNQGRWKIRSQYVRSALKSIENIPPCKAVKKQGHESGNPEHTCDMGSPILGIVTQHLNFEEPCCVSDLVLDEKVSLLHGTTFIGRLEETVICERNVLNAKQG